MSAFDGEVLPPEIYFDKMYSPGTPGIDDGSVDDAGANGPGEKGVGVSAKGYGRTPVNGKNTKEERPYNAHNTHFIH